MALFSLNELNHFRVKLARNYTIVPFEFSKIIIDKKACLQALKLNVQLLHLLQFGITGRPECFRLKAAELTYGLLMFYALLPLLLTVPRWKLDFPANDVNPRNLNLVASFPLVGDPGKCL